MPLKPQMIMLFLNKCTFLGVQFVFYNLESVLDLKQSIVRFERLRKSGHGLKQMEEHSYHCNRLLKAGQEYVKVVYTLMYFSYRPLVLALGRSYICHSLKYATF